MHCEEQVIPWKSATMLTSLTWPLASKSNRPSTWVFRPFRSPAGGERRERSQINNQLQISPSLPHLMAADSPCYLRHLTNISQSQSQSQSQSHTHTHTRKQQHTLQHLKTSNKVTYRWSSSHWMWWGRSHRQRYGKGSRHCRSGSSRWG